MRIKKKNTKELDDLQSFSFPLNYWVPSEKESKEISSLIAAHKKSHSKKSRLQKVS